MVRLYENGQPRGSRACNVIHFSLKCRNMNLLEEKKIDSDTQTILSAYQTPNLGKFLEMNWLGGRDSNPDTQIQSLQSYR